MALYLGAELGSTRIKAVTINENHIPVAAGGFDWGSRLENGIWTYDLALVWQGLKTAISQIPDRDQLTAAGISAMMHGYLAFDENWELLVPFRTWQNTVTAPAAAELTQALGINMPQRYCSVHLYQAILSGEPHANRVAHITTLSSYVHYMLTGENVVGLGDASGMFPLDNATLDYNEEMLQKYDALAKAKGFPRSLRAVLPKALPAGTPAGKLTARGAALLEGLLPEGLPFAPPEGDSGTSLTAANAVSPRTGMISAGTSIFANIVLERPLQRLHTELDPLSTPAGKPVVAAACNNGTRDLNAWTELLAEAAALFGAQPTAAEVFSALYRKSMEADPDCGGLVSCNYLGGENITHLDAGRPMLARLPDSRLTLANFYKSLLYGSMATLRIGMEILEQEQVKIDRLVGLGGMFKTPGVAQQYFATACKTKVLCQQTAGEGGAYGIALLTAYRMQKAAGETLEDYLEQRVFKDAKETCCMPDGDAAPGFDLYVARYKQLLEAERLLAETLN